MLDFEEPILSLEKKITELKRLMESGQIDLVDEIRTLEQKAAKIKKEVYSGLTSWQRIQLARHPQRPLSLDYIELIFDSFIELHGDRLYGDDKAIVAGLAKFDGRPVVIVGHQKGKNTKENLMRNFGMPHPEGFAKALRMMKLAEKLGIAVISFIDTPGAYPGIGAEERGQAVAIARNLMHMAQLATPIIVAVIGEGGSGGALGIGVGDRILMFEHAYYSVCSPEACASILWKDAAKATEAARALKLTAQDLIKLGIIDEIIEEPLGGAHRDPKLAANNLKEALKRNLEELSRFAIEELLKRRYEKYRKIGIYEEKPVG